MQYSCCEIMWITMLQIVYLLLLLCQVIVSVSGQCPDSSLEESLRPESTYVGPVGVTMVVDRYVSVSDINNLAFWMEYKKSEDESSPMLSERFMPASNTHSNRTLKIFELKPDTHYDLWLILQKDGCTVNSSTVIKVKTKDLEWTSAAGREYFFSKNLSHVLDFAAANAFCRDQDNAMLMSISSEEENEFVIEGMPDIGSWLGLRFPHNADVGDCRNCALCDEVDTNFTNCDLCDKCRSKWYWTDGSDSTFNKWGEEQPTGNHNCAAVRSRGAWLDVNCTDQHYFVCYRAARPALSDWQIATIVACVLLFLLAVSFLVLLVCVCKLRAELKRKIVPEANGVYLTADGKTDLTISF